MIGTDANILFYAIDNTDAEKHNKRVSIIAEIFHNPHQYKISLQVLAELNYSVKRKNKNAVPLTLQLTESLLAFPEILTHYSEKQFRLSLRQEKLH